jgi:predicted GNAT family N-acyltransferase
VTYSIIPTNWQTHQQPLREIRERVFIHEQQVPIADEWDDKDEAATHFLVTTATGKAIACARLLLETQTNQNLYHIGRVAVLAEYRHQAIGRELMTAVLTYCKQEHSDYKICLHAQTTRQRFYEHLGFTACGEVFMDAGIPHIEMWLT